LRFLVCAFVQDVEKDRIAKKAEFVQALSKDLTRASLNVEQAIQCYRIWNETDKALSAKVNVAEELESFDELAKPAAVAAPESKKKFATRGGIPVLE
jgi:hypothetical protein